MESRPDEAPELTNSIECLICFCSAATEKIRNSHWETSSVFGLRSCCSKTRLLRATLFRIRSNKREYATCHGHRWKRREPLGIRALPGNPENDHPALSRAAPVGGTRSCELISPLLEMNASPGAFDVMSAFNGLTNGVSAA